MGGNSNVSFRVFLNASYLTLKWMLVSICNNNSRPTCNTSFHSIKCRSRDNMLILNTLVNCRKVVRAGNRKLQGDSFFWTHCPPTEWLSTPRQWLLLLARAKFKLHILKRKSLQRILIHCYLAQTCDRLARVGKTSVLHNLLYILCRFALILDENRYVGMTRVVFHPFCRGYNVKSLHQILICFT